MQLRRCKNCQEWVKPPKVYFCSRECGRKYHNKMRHLPYVPPPVCRLCHKSKPYIRHTSPYCSAECAKEARRASWRRYRRKAGGYYIHPDAPKLEGKALMDHFRELAEKRKSVANQPQFRAKLS